MNLEEQKIPHLWHVDAGSHAWPVWKNDLYLLSQKMFREDAVPKDQASR